LLVNTPLHPPLTVVEAKNEVQAALICACELHDGTVTLFPQLNTTAGAVATVKRFVQV